jgi:hypothetical protein
MKIPVLALLALAPFAAQAKDAISLEWSICDDPAHELTALGEPGVPGKNQVINYYDTARPVYAQQGIFFRAKAAGGETDSEVKVRLAQVTPVPQGVDCTWERYGAQVTYTCGLESPVQAQASMWAQDQIGFVDQFVRVDWPVLVAFGPYQNPKWAVNVNGQSGVLDTVDVQSLHLMELEIKVPSNDGQTVYAAVTALLQERGVLLCAIQESKTLRLFRALGLL